MSKTVLCILKMLMLAEADTLSKYSENSVASKECDSMCSDSDFIQIVKFLENILSKPTSPRAFVEFYNGLLNEKDISVTFRWNQPEFTDEVIQGYTVQYFGSSRTNVIKIYDDKNISATILECTVHNLNPNTTYSFQVRAHTKVSAGPYTDLIDVLTMHENPIPQLLIRSRNGIDIWDLDSKIHRTLVNTSNVVDITYSMAEHNIYWSNRNKDLMMLEMNKNNITKIDNLNKIAYHLCIDWIARNLYWIQKDMDHDLDNIIKLDLTVWEKFGRVKYDKILEIKKSTVYSSHLNILPYIGIFYLRNFTENNEGKIIQSNLDGNNTHTIQKNLTAISCSLLFNMRKADIAVDVEIDGINTKKPLIYWLLYNSLFVTDFNVSMCNLILQIKEVSCLITLTIDKTNIYLLSNTNIYVLKKKYALLNSTDASKYQRINISYDIYQIYAFKPLQLYPPTRCLTPDKKVYNADILTTTINNIIINFPEPVPKNGCEKYNLPTTLYTIYISCCLNNEFNKFDNFTVQTYQRYYEIQNLTSFTEYKLLLVISNFYFDQLSMDPFSSEIIQRTKPSKFDAPKNVTVQALTPTTAVVYWMPPKKLNCDSMIYKVYWILIILVNNTRQIYESNKSINQTEHKIDRKFFTIIEPLIPEQSYRVYVRMHPVNYSELYIDSLDEILYMYSEPNNITLTEVSINSMNISWIPSVNLTINYKLEYKTIEMQKWQTANNSELNYEGKVMYYIKNLLPGTLYQFRLLLKYPRYEENFTWPSDGKPFTFTTLTSDISNTSGILVMQYYLSFTISFVAIVTVICVCYFYYLYRQRKKSNEQVLPPIMSDIELAILHEMPNDNIQFNTLYSPMLQYNSNDYVLTKIKREEITIGKHLGNGAFGMVFQGKVKNLEKPGTEIFAAIKMLSKNAFSEEKKKFLEEARLMNCFRHKHVLRLLAVCLDGEDSPLIVLELMEGDLLRYLRDSRKLQPSDPHALRLQDLFAMCEDVAQGCCYLENLHIVHRDLACRNCLVSARDRENRVIKIGDFGLARDVYTNDYYRMKEQGPVPVRWMAPESLMVKKFTSQSDVWSFGVVMWEITSLGKQPYIGKENQEVIDYVCAGGKLPMPLNCPPTLYELMLRCWSPVNNRPNFKLCLENIIVLRNNIEDTLLSPVNMI